MHLFINSLAKGGLISEVILTLVSLLRKGAESLPWAENSNFPPISLNNLFNLSAQGGDLAPFVGNGTKVKIPSAIKQPLIKIKHVENICFYWYMIYKTRLLRNGLNYNI